MAKHVIFFSDGTWNSPDQDPDEDGAPDCTNVYKAFLALEGANPAGALKAAREQEKEVRDGGVTQIAKYIHGVGDSGNAIHKIVGGVFGGGVIARVVRGYTFISRNYEPGAQVHILGFSRGAYTARALAGLIVSQGLLGTHLTGDKELAYRCGLEAWDRYRATSPNRPGWWERLIEGLTHPREFFRRDVLKDSDLRPLDSIATVGVWDTVGALGIPTYKDDKRVDRFQFSNRTLSPKVKRGLHAVALDEQRIDFTPTLWEPGDNVTQVLFPGAHADVGGGYANNAQESGLSNVTLRWMIEHLRQAGVRFVEAEVQAIVPDAGAVAHKPWTHGVWGALPAGSRTFPRGLAEHPSIAERMARPGVIAEPGEAAAPYRPANRPLP